MNSTSKKHARRWGAGMIAAGMLLGGGVLPAGLTEAAPAAVQAKAVSSSVVLKANGKISSQTGLFQEGKVWIPVTFMRDALGMPLSYDKAGKTYTIGKGSMQLTLTNTEYGYTTIKVNNYYIGEYDVKNLNGRLYVPFDLLSDYMGFKGDWSAATGRLNVMKRTQNAVTLTTESYIKDYKEAPIKLDYPQVSGLASAEAEKAINNTIRQTIMNYAAEAEEQISRRAADDRPYEFEGGYVVTYNENGVLSLITNQYGYTGGAHGMTYRNAFTFSLKDGKRLLLGDLFGANPNYKKQLNAKLSAGLKANGGYLGGFTGLNTEKYFYLKDGKAVVFFQLYEYTAYAEGFPEFTFSFKELLPDGSSPFKDMK